MKVIKEAVRLLCIILAAALTAGTAADAAAEKSGKYTIIIDFHGMAPDNTAVTLEDVPFALYKVGSMKNGRWTLAGDFAGADISLDDMSASGQMKAAEELYYYAVSHRIKPETGKTDSTGKAVFSGVREGLYLAVQTKDYLYHDGVFRSAPFLMSVPAENGDGEDEVYAMPKNEWISNEDRIIIGLRDLTIYTGGNELGGNLNGYPTPRYTGIPENVTYEVNGEPWDGSQGEYPFQVVYTLGDEQEDLSVEDTWQFVPEDTEAGLYVAHIIPREAGAVITAAEPGKKAVKVEFKTAILTVRDVLHKESNHQLGVIVSEASETELNQKQKELLQSGLAAVTIPKESRITVNGDATLGVVGIEDAALLFDDILYFNIIDENTGNMVLEDRAAKALKSMGREMQGRMYQSKYLDLVQDQDGNLWLSSSLGSTVYWPYPEGTDKNTHFDLFHFKGLHREYDIKGNPNESEAVYTAPMEKVEIENTDDGIRFYIPESGFSPFVLSWVPEQIPDNSEESNGQTDESQGTHNDENEDGGHASEKPSGNFTKTGDNIPVEDIACVAFLSGIAMICLLIYRRDKKRRS